MITYEQLMSLLPKFSFTELTENEIFDDGKFNTYPHLVDSYFRQPSISGVSKHSFFIGSCGTFVSSDVAEIGASTTFQVISAFNSSVLHV
ncbi:hypothetical protein IKI14_02350 [bacterium]|nr:hypothetical protein [bacterium]